jgi:hypothetical protein
VTQADEAWSQAFSEALVDHVLGAGPYPGHVDESASAWLKASFAHETPREAELEALLRLLERAETTPPSLHELARVRLAEHVAGRALTAADVERVRRCVYAGTAVTQVEVRWLFALDAESSGRANDPAWRDLFVKAALCHVAGRSDAAALEAQEMLAREARFAEPRPAVTPLSVLQSVFAGGLKGYMTRATEPGWVEGMENRYAATNAATEAEAEITFAEAAALLGVADEDGKHTENEEALLAELRKQQSEPG